MYKIERLKTQDYDELLSFLNRVFQYPKDNGFDKLLPAMWRRDDEYMEKHFVIREDGKIKACLGLYPLYVHVGGQTLLFVTCGNIGTDPECRGKGYMKALMHYAMEELEHMGADAARLSGQRQRYERYGFEMVGTTQAWQLTAKNLMEGRNAGKIRGDLFFQEIGSTDTEVLAFARSLQTAEPCYVERGDARRFYDVMCAWRSKPYIAYLPDKTPAGILVVSEDKKAVAEQYAATPELKYGMLASWLKVNDLDDLNFYSAPWDHGFNQLAGMDCEMLSFVGTTQCRILHWEKIADAFLKLDRLDRPGTFGNLVLEIKGYGSLSFTGNTCQKTEETADISLMPEDAARFLFGLERPENVCALPSSKAAFIRSQFPIPLYWNGQDRV